MRPKDTPVGLADSRIFYRANMLERLSRRDGDEPPSRHSSTPVFWARWRSTASAISIRPCRAKRELRYFNGSAGGNDVASLAKRVIVIMPPREAQIARRGVPSDEPGFCRWPNPARNWACAGTAPTASSPTSGDGVRSGNPLGGASFPCIGGEFGGCVGQYGLCLAPAGHGSLNETTHGRGAPLLRDEIDPKSVYLGGVG